MYKNTLQLHKMTTTTLQEILQIDLIANKICSQLDFDECRALATTNTQFSGVMKYNNWKLNNIQSRVLLYNGLNYLIFYEPMLFNQSPPNTNLFDYVYDHIHTIDLSRTFTEKNQTKENFKFLPLWYKNLIRGYHELIPKLTNLVELKLNNNMLYKIGGFENIHTIDLSNSWYISELNTIKNVSVVKMSNCHMIDDISGLSNCDTVILDGCADVVDISPLSNVRELDLTLCRGVVDVSALSGVFILNLSLCINVPREDVIALSKTVHKLTTRAGNVLIDGKSEIFYDEIRY